MVTVDLDTVLKRLRKLFVLTSPRSSCAPLGARRVALHASLPSVLTAAASLLAASG